jgi:hypothetical protein
MNYITICISIFTEHYTICCKKISVLRSWRWTKFVRNMLSWSSRSIKLLLLHPVGVPYYFTYSDDARSDTNQVYFYNSKDFISKFYCISNTLELTAITIDTETGSTDRVHYSFKIVQLAEITVYQLRHHGSVHFCHFSIRRIFDNTPIRR